VARRTTFDAIRAGSKVGVDIVGNGAEDVFEMTTDEFFAGLRPDVRFDVVFIDACHNYQQVLRDYNNAAARCPDGAIFLHDMVPPSIEFTGNDLCWDAYKLLGPLLQHPGHSVKVLDSDYGLTVVLKPQPVVPYKYWAQLSYEEFASMPLSTVSLPEMMAVIAELCQG
ncbi:unnamed protein product, partial [marine sediment metagenome]